MADVAFVHDSTAPFILHHTHIAVERHLALLYVWGNLVSAKPREFESAGVQAAQSSAYGWFGN